MLKTKLYKLDDAQQSTKSQVLMGGSCSNGLMVITSDQMSEPETQTLRDILKSIKHELEESAHLKIAEGTNCHISSIARKHAIHKIIAFGINTRQIGMQIHASAYQLLRLEDLQIIFSHSIAELNDDKQKKMALWKTLQQL